MGYPTLATAAAVAGSVAGLSAGSAGSAPPDPVPEPVAIASRPEDFALIQYAESVLTSHCMQALGFEYRPVDYGQVIASARANARSEQLVNNPYDAAVEGPTYRTVDEVVIDDPNAARFDAMSADQQAAYTLALNGDMSDSVEVMGPGVGVEVSTTGCVAEAKAALFGSVEQAWATMLLNAGSRNHVASETMFDPDVEAAVAAWSACLAESGYEFSWFAQPRAAAIEHPDQAARIAEADAACVAESDLLTIFRSTYADQTTRFLDEQADALTASRAAEASALDRAYQLLTTIEG